MTVLDERKHRVMLNVLFWLTICALLAALIYLIRSDSSRWPDWTGKLALVFVVLGLFDRLRYVILARRRRKADKQELFVLLLFGRLGHAILAGHRKSRTEN